jgi:hypothetical protein
VTTRNHCRSRVRGAVRSAAYAQARRADRPAVVLSRCWREGCCTGWSRTAPRVGLTDTCLTRAPNGDKTMLATSAIQPSRAQPRRSGSIMPGKRKRSSTSEHTAGLKARGTTGRTWRPTARPHPASRRSDEPRLGRTPFPTLVARLRPREPLRGNGGPRIRRPAQVTRRMARAPDACGWDAPDGHDGADGRELRI